MIVASLKMMQPLTWARVPSTPCPQDPNTSQGEKQANISEHTSIQKVLLTKTSDEVKF
ncbi:hypothetical protein KFK09_016900 [Dendrobium nobile]|uniref:Uncharacterized protein n=1 Tax=Dendrobium nobile TaxID=94219 RepID=A0A8T3B5Z9_DENNO|nr:hypothetical protein KFK09_016900 [Dendrobium nobile]